MSQPTVGGTLLARFLLINLEEQHHEFHSSDHYRRCVGLAGQHDHGNRGHAGQLLNIVVGIVGAFLGGLLLAPLFDTGTINQGDSSIGSLLVSLAGAVIPLGIIGFFRKRRHV